jgi:hypothetical protein
LSTVHALSLRRFSESHIPRWFQPGFPRSGDSAAPTRRRIPGDLRDPVRGLGGEEVFAKPLTVSDNQII